MNQKEACWKRAKKQAAHIQKIKSQHVKDRQIVLLCKTLLIAMRAG